MHAAVSCVVRHRKAAYDLGKNLPDTWALNLRVYCDVQLSKIEQNPHRAESDVRNDRHGLFASRRRCSAAVALSRSGRRPVAVGASGNPVGAAPC